MITVDTIIVGGGPAGSSCAWRLGKRGVDCLVLDRAEFPRLKLCAGWVTPQVLRDLEIEPGEYPFSFLTFESLRFNFKGLGISLKNQAALDPADRVRRVAAAAVRCDGGNAQCAADPPR